MVMVSGKALLLLPQQDKGIVLRGGAGGDLGVFCSSAYHTEGSAFMVSSNLDYYPRCHLESHQLISWDISFATHKLWGWAHYSNYSTRCCRDGSVVTSTGCSSRGPEFNSYEQRGGSQPSMMGSDALFWHAGVQADRALIYIK